MRVLVADVGFGTTDILVYESDLPVENCPQMVIPSRTQQLAHRIREATAAGRAVAMDGVTMGGGPVGRALKAHLEAGLGFYATPAAALSFNDDIDLVRSWGVSVSDQPVADAPGEALVVTGGDLDLPRLLRALEDLGIGPGFDGAAIAVQDHGFAPGSSNRKFRFQQWRRLLEADDAIDSLAFPADAIPDCFTRMQAAADAVRALGDVIVMDTGPAALRGALSDELPGLPAGRRLVANCGNGHTLAAIVEAGRIDGVVEHHTSRLDAHGFAGMIRGFASGTLTDASVFDDGGHGCVPPAVALDIDAAAPVITTGPRRERFRDADLPLEFAAPFGDMMLTGCYGLAGAWLKLAGGPSS